MDKQAVLITLKFPEGKTDEDNVFWALMDLEELMMETLEEGNIGIVDGHEFAMCEGCDDEITYFIYGISADIIYKLVKPLVIGLPYLPGSFIIKRYGEDEDDEVVEYLAEN